MKFLFSFCVLFIILGDCAFTDQKFDCLEICPCPLNNPQTEKLNPNIENCQKYLTLFTAINDLRKKNSLSPLKVTSKLNQYSQVWANYLSHRNLSYIEPYNIYGSNLIYSYRTFSNNILDVKEVLDFWINTHKDLSASRSDFESNLEALFDAKSEFIGFGCSSSKVDPLRLVGSNERYTQYFLVVNIEINSSKLITTLSCNSVPSPKSQIPLVSGSSTAFRDRRSLSENDLNSISNFSFVRLLTLNNASTTNSPVKPITIHSTSPVPNQQSTINIPTSLNTNSKHYIDLITTIPGITTTRRPPSLNVSTSTLSELKSELAQEPISEPNFLINPSSSVKPSIIHSPSLTPNNQFIIKFPTSTQSKSVFYQNTKPTTTTTLKHPLFPVSSTAESEPMLISAPNSTSEQTPERTAQNNSKLSFEANNSYDNPKN